MSAALACDCGAATAGKWAGIHSPWCPSIKGDRTGAILKALNDAKAYFEPLAKLSAADGYVPNEAWRLCGAIDEAIASIKEIKRGLKP